MSDKVRIYLDTSVISALFDDNNPERRDITRNLFSVIAGFDVHISDITIAEIDDTSDTALRARMRDSIGRFQILPMTDDAKRLAGEYIRHGAIPQSHEEDAFHVAVAVVNGMDYLLSWNFKHIIRLKTRDIVRMVNTLDRRSQITLLTPGEIL